MSEHVLVSPLGFSPGAVSGLAFALMEADYPISRVVTLGTSHQDVQGAAQILKNLFRDMEEMAYESLHIAATELRRTDDSTADFVAQMGLALESANQNGNTVHVGVTGGRSGMGALAALATNLYGADHLWHFWVTDDIEKGGRLHELSGSYTIDNRYLNPTIQEGSYEIVELPFVDLRPLHPLIWDYHRNGRLPQDTPLAQLLTKGQVKRLQDVFPAGLTISKADELVEMIQSYPQLERDKQDKAMIRLGRILTGAGVTDEATEDRLRKLMQAGLPVEHVLTLAANVEDKTGFWHWLQDNKDQISTTTTVAGFVLNGLELWLKVKGYI